MWVQSLVGELRFHRLHGVAKKIKNKIKQNHTALRNVPKNKSLISKPENIFRCSRNFRYSELSKAKQLYRQNSLRLSHAEEPVDLLGRVNGRQTREGVVVFQTSLTSFVGCLWNWFFIDQTLGGAHADHSWANTPTGGSQSVPGPCLVLSSSHWYQLSTVLSKWATSFLHLITNRHVHGTMDGHHRHLTKGICRLQFLTAVFLNPFGYQSGSSNQAM